MKKVLALILIAAISASLVACSSTPTSSSSPSSSTSENSKPLPSSDVSASSIAAASSAASEVQNSDSGTIGDYSVTIESARLAKDYQSKPVAIIKYKWTNNSDDANSFEGALNQQVFQDGVQLDPAFSIEDKAYNTDDGLREIKKGVSLEVEKAFALSNTSSPIEADVTDFLGLSEQKVTKNFDITKLG